MICQEDSRTICETATREWTNEDGTKSKRSITACGCAKKEDVKKRFREY